MSKTYQILNFFVSVFCLITFQASAQVPQFEWAANLEWVNEMRINDVTTDSNHNVIIVGSFNSWQDLDPGPLDNLIQGNGTDMFVMKLDPNGSLTWVKVFGNESTFNQEGLSIIADSSNNIYINGYFPSSSDSIDLDPGVSVYKIAPTTSKKGFILSLDSNGEFRWAHQLNGYFGALGNNPFQNRMAYSEDGTVLLTEKFSGTQDFDPGNGTSTISAIGNSSYILKLDLDGNFIWVKPFIDGINSRGIDTNLNGDVFLTGSFQGSPDFDPGATTFTQTSNGTLSDGFVLKLDDLGSFNWAKSFGGAAQERPYDIACDNLGHSYITGFYEGTTDLNPGVGVYSATALGDEDNFVLHLDDQGDFVWSLTMPVDLWFPEPSVEVDTGNNLYMAGSFRDTINADVTGSTYELISYPSSILFSNVDFFCTKYNQAGSIIWSTHIGGENADYLDGLHVAANGDVHLTGNYDDSVDFDPGPGVTNYMCTGGDDGFNLKLSQCYQTTPVPDIISLSDTVASCSILSLPVPTANEFCTGVVMGVPDVSFPISTIGLTTITWTYDAGNGFVTTQSQNVTIIDTIAPSPDQISLSDISFECSATSLTPPTASDNCGGNVIVTNDATFPIMSSETITWTYDDGNGNTSTQPQHVIITPINNSILQVDGITLSADATGYSYQWIDCNNGNSPINGATSQNFVATANGNYAVEISNGTCTETSNCMTIDEVNIEDLNASQAIHIYPNPSMSVFKITSQEPIDSESITVTNNIGQRVPFNVSEKQDGLEIEILQESGLYFISLGNSSVYRLVRL